MELGMSSWVALGLTVFVGILLVWGIFAVIDSKRDHIHCDVVWDRNNHCVYLKIQKKYGKYGRRCRVHIYVNKKMVKEEYIPVGRSGETHMKYRLPLAMRGDTGDTYAVRDGDKVEVHVDGYSICDVLSR